MNKLIEKLANELEKYSVDELQDMRESFLMGQKKDILNKLGVSEEEILSFIKEQKKTAIIQDFVNNILT